MEDTVWKAVQEQCPDAHQVDLLIALPSFNYASTIESVLKAILAGLNASFADASILIVNADVGSQDGTPEIVKQTVGDLFPVAWIQPLGEGSSASHVCPQSVVLFRHARARGGLQILFCADPAVASQSLRRHRCKRAIGHSGVDTSCSPTRCWRAVRTMWRPCSAAHDMREV